MSKIDNKPKSCKSDQWPDKGAAWLGLAEALVDARKHFVDELTLAEGALAGAQDWGRSVREVLEHDVKRARAALDQLNYDVGRNPKTALTNYRRWQANHFAPAGREQCLAKAVGMVLLVAKKGEHFASMRDGVLRDVMNHDCDDQACTRCAKSVLKAHEARENGGDGRNRGPSAGAKALVAELAGVSVNHVHKACATARGKTNR